MENQITLTRDQVVTVLATIECFKEQNHNSFQEMNCTMGSITIKDMVKLESEMRNWIKQNTEEDEEEWYDVDDDYYSNAPCDTYGMCAGISCSHYYDCHR
jgi:hypothetical protein